MMGSFATYQLLAHTERLITFLNSLKEILIPPKERGLACLYVIIWDNVAFHHSHLVNEWFAAQPCIMMQFLPAYLPFLNLNPIEEFFSAWKWKVYDQHMIRSVFDKQMPLLEAMNDGCLAIGAEDCQGWIRHARRYSPRWISKENLQCNVDENKFCPLSFSFILCVVNCFENVMSEWANVFKQLRKK